MRGQTKPNPIKDTTSKTASVKTVDPSRPLSMRIKAAIGAAFFVAAAAVVWFTARPAYHHYRELHSLEQAKVFFSRGDWSKASLCARRALALNPRSLGACRIMARLAELAGAPRVLDWRRRVAELSPAIEDQLALAATALRVQARPFPLAAQTLDALALDAKDLPAYHVLCAEMALKLNQSSCAEAHFLEASRLEPADELHQLNLAVLRLRATNEVMAAAARATLERLRADTNLGPTALRWLVSDRLEHGDLAAAQALSGELVVQSAATLDDRLTHLGILRKANSSDFGSYLSAVQRVVSTNAGGTYTLCAWMLANSRADQALRWLTNCPQPLQAQSPVRLARAECHAALKDWNGLTQFLESDHWGELEFLRLAWLSRVAGEQKEEFAAEAQWRLAVREAGDGPGRMLALLKLATNWGRARERQDLLWQLAQKNPGERWALQELDRIYVAEGNTRGLNKVHAALVAANSRDIAARNNLAATSLLLKLNLPRAHELSKEIYAEHPEEPVIASTYGYSLHLQGRTQEGLAVMEKLPSASLKAPAVALYYGVLLRASGRSDEAEPYLALARGTRLLPEEQALLVPAQQGM
jgi:predicted Zn-dependent protease